MPQNQQRRSEMWHRGHNDALAGDPPNESYYHYYYDYRLGYDQARRDQRRTRRQRTLAALGQRMIYIGPVLLLLVIGYGAWQRYGPETASDVAAVQPTNTPRPTPRPTLTQIVPTPTPAPTLQPNGYAVVSGLDGSVLRARSQPGTSAAIQTRFREGQTVRILEGPQSADNLEWWRVEADGVSGWAAAPYLTPIEPPAP